MIMTFITIIVTQNGGRNCPSGPHGQPMRAAKQQIIGTIAGQGQLPPCKAAGAAVFVFQWGSPTNPNPNWSVPKMLILSSKWD
jgi:hypothetical protein